jgi:alpha-D-xyloside xylohydrolase
MTMKFKRGHWLVKPFVRALYAAECFRVRRDGDEVELLVPGAKVCGRQDTMGPALTVRLSSPLEGVVRVGITHYAGMAVKKPDFELFRGSAPVEIEEDDEKLCFRSGLMEARVSKKKGAWGIEYRYDGRYLTSTGFRGMAHFTDEKTGKGYVQEALELSVGECVYGLGERFTPFVKNGQVVEIWRWCL